MYARADVDDDEDELRRFCNAPCSVVGGLQNSDRARRALRAPREAMVVVSMDVRANGETIWGDLGVLFFQILLLA